MTKERIHIQIIGRIWRSERSNEAKLSKQMRQEEDEDMHSIGGNEANHEQEITFISKEGKVKCMAVPQYP